MKKATIINIKRTFSISPYHLTTLPPYHLSTLSLFLIIPSIFLLVATLAHYSRGPFYLFNVDPEYFYMYNGIILGGGNLSIQYFAHPGTPLHYLIALSARITDLFQHGSYMKNFVDDPEKFIHSANLFLNIIIAIVLFYCGKLAWKYTGSAWAALAFQLSPFAGFSLLTTSGRLIPEALMMVPLLLLGLLILKNTLESEENRNTRRDMVLYALIIGFGMACKLTFIPVIVLPIILFKTSFREKLRYLLYTFIFFIIFAYPLIFNLSDSWKWISGLFTHSGKYGTGSANIIDLSSIGKNFELLFDYCSGFFYVLFSSLGIALIFLIPYLQKKLNPDPRIIRAILALDITILALVAAVLKHFEIYYFVPFTIFKILIVLLLVFLFLKLKPISRNKFLNWAVYLVFIAFLATTLVSQVREFRLIISAAEEKAAGSVEKSRRITSFVDKNKPIIIDSPFYGSPFIEFAHYNGFLTSRHLKGFYRDYLKEKFPNYYNCPDWTDKFYSWDNFVDFSDILAKVKTSFYVYIGEGKSKDLPLIERRISQALDLEKAETRILYKDPSSGEQLIEIIVNY